MPVSELAKRITSEVLPAPFKIGDTVKHPSGRMVRITDGQYWGKHGLSNFWYWRAVKKNGKLSKKVECGYGW